MPRTFYRTVLQVEILSEERYDPHKELDLIYDDITDGDHNGDVVVITENEAVEPKFAATILRASGSDPGFFGLDDEGNTVDGWEA